jgi:hypothetical protein
MDDPVRAYVPSGADARTLDSLRRLRWVLEPGEAGQVELSLTLRVASMVAGHPRL